MAELLTRRAELAPASFDPQAGTVRCVWSTGAGVLRRDAAGPYREHLSLDPGHVDLTHLRGAPVLDTHRNDALARVLGVVREVEADGREGRALIQFSERPEVQPYRRDVETGVIRGVSIGYAVSAWREGRAADGTRTRTATRWQPREISFVPVPADAGACVRSESELTTEAAAAPAEQAQNDQAALNRAEVNRQIRELAGLARVEQGVTDGLIDRGATVEQARAELFDALVQRSAGGQQIRHHRVEMGASGDDPAVRVERMAEALHCRINPAQRPSEQARPYMHRRVLELAGELLEGRGERGVRGMAPDTLLQRAMHSTSDFPALLQATGNRVLLAAFTAAASPLKSLARQTTLSDFRAKTSLRLSGIGQLVEVNEHGEIRHTTRAETKESYRLKTFGRMFGLTRNAIINDDLNGLGDFSTVAGRAAAETENNELAALLAANAGSGVNMDDGKSLFHADHGNKAASGSAITVAALAAARLAMRAQKDLDGSTPIAVSPKFLLVAPAKETEAEQVLASLAAATIQDVNPFSGRLQLLIEPRFTGNAWRIFADPATAPVLEYAYLSSAQGPQMASREGWDVLGMEFRVVLDFGAGVLDHRGAYLNPGA